MLPSSWAITQGPGCSPDSGPHGPKNRGFTITEVKVSTRNITRAFRADIPDDRIAGKSWYATARLDCAREIAAIVVSDTENEEA